MGLFQKMAGAARRWARSYGRFQPSRKVAEMFLQGRVLPELRYYHIGSEKAPQAIIAIERGLTLQSGAWQPMAPETGGLAAAAGQMGAHVDPGRAPAGWRILDPAGEAIGIAYGPGKSVVQVKADGLVKVHLPETLPAKP